MKLRNMLSSLALVAACTGGSGTGSQDGAPLGEAVDAAAAGTEDGDAQTELACAPSGRFYLELESSITEGSLITFAATVEITPQTLSMTLQPLCAPNAQCTPWTPVGAPFQLSQSTLDECSYSVGMSDALIPGQANTLSATDMTANIRLEGTISSLRRLCGKASGTINNVPIDPAWFAAERLADDAPASGPLSYPVSSCQ